MDGIYLKNELYTLINNDTSIFEFIQSGSLDGIWYWDIENPEMEWMSPKFWETLGYNPEEKKHLAREWQDLIFQEDLNLAIANFEKHCADPHHPYDQIVRYKHKNGSTIWIRCRGLAIRDTNGKVIRMLGAHTDITDLKETEKNFQD
ncbi:PAS domain-containing protein [Enterococcus sp. DIV1314a]|uniref:PAS domain-containing protein n=1 Tax=Enterococcus sp. DIV1314a TaxID=2774660 RepID=UPI003F24F5AA